MIKREQHSVAKKTRDVIWSISKALHLTTPPRGYKASSKITGMLESTSKPFPFPEENLKPFTVKVVQGDTLNTAVALHNARELMGCCQDTQKVCVLNFVDRVDDETSTLEILKSILDNLQT